MECSLELLSFGRGQIPRRYVPLLSCLYILAKTLITVYSQHSSYLVSIVFRSLIFSQNSCVFPFLSSPHIVSKTIEIMNFFLFVSVIVYRVSDVFVYCREYHNLLVILTPVRLWQIPYGLH